jgi:hypothetical protein
MIIFEYNEKQEQLEIHGTSDDLLTLANILTRLAKRTGDHEHLMTPSWSGNELGEELVSKQDRLINHVKISCWEVIPQED